MQLRIGTVFKAFSIGALLLLGAAPALAGKTQNVVLIVSDGLRWQEILPAKSSCARSAGTRDRITTIAKRTRLMQKVYRCVLNSV